MTDKIPGRNPPEPQPMQPTERATCFLFGTLGNVEHRGHWCAIRIREGPWVRTYCGATVKFDVHGQLEGEAGCPSCLKAMRQAEKDNHPVEPPEPAECRPEPTPTPRIEEPSKQAKMQRKTIALQTALGATAIRGSELLVGNNALKQDADNALVALSQILAELERIPCMSEDCDGIEDGEPATKGRPSPTRCHRCVAVRLVKSMES